MNLELPMLESSVNVTGELPFDKEYVSYVLRSYLIDGKPAINIDQDYFRHGYNNTGRYASTVLDYYGLVSNNNTFDNKGIYNGLPLESVVEFLDQQDEKYKRIASALAKVEFIPNYSEKELGEQLEQLYSSAEEGTKILTLHLFGIKYANLIEKNNYSCAKILEYANIPLTTKLDTEIRKGVRLSKYVSLEDMPKVTDFNIRTEQDLKEIEDTGRITGGTNVIYYGAPGCGKSVKVRKEINNNGFIDLRTTFYPDYTNGEFVGQVVPKVDKSGKIFYKIEPGYFTKILFDAMTNPTKKYCLVIEEINRGNASAIFGDVFQLLDRDKNGTSEFEISNDIISQYFNDNGYELKNNKIRIPSNLWIKATMNTSDQNVYTLDTAFKRRWKLEKLTNKFDDKEPYDTTLRSMLIPGSEDVTWEDFIDKINNAIFDRNPHGVNAEDKQLGKYFVGTDVLVHENGALEVYSNIDDAKKAFAEKVLMYLWDDVAKLNKEIWFDPKYRTLDDLLKAFNNPEIGLLVFNDLFDKKDNEEDLDNHE